MSGKESSFREKLLWGVIILLSILVMANLVVIQMMMRREQELLTALEMLSTANASAASLSSIQNDSGKADQSGTLAAAEAPEVAQADTESDSGEENDAIHTLPPPDVPTQRGTPGTPVPTQVSRPTQVLTPAPRSTSATPRPAGPTRASVNTATPTPTSKPTAKPTQKPTKEPTDEPTEEPTSEPTDEPATPTPPPIDLPDDPIERINYYRAWAGMQPIVADPTMNDGAQKHALYMASLHQIAYMEDPGYNDPSTNPYYTPEGDRAARRGNLWLGGGTNMWVPTSPIEDWMRSPTHRLWILYPQAARMGFGFSQHAGNSAAVLEVFGGWDTSLPFTKPVRYPANGQEGVPATRFGVSIQFPYANFEGQFPYNGPSPSLSTSMWVDQEGNTVPFEVIGPANNEYMKLYGNAI
jgi:uncharacterized protein YkwD